MDILAIVKVPTSIVREYSREEFLASCLEC